ncbi:MAG: hypothetical protein FWD57_13665 [Polyangiaceae bacterium]|nr:hypothetical protein [Polyangiaceae bacterium]
MSLDASSARTWQNRNEVAMSMHRPKRSSSKSSKVEQSSFLTPTAEKNTNWNAATEGKPESEFVPYSIKNSYTVGNLINHPKLGNGVVVEAEATKVAVLFETGERRLAHALAS